MGVVKSLGEKRGGGGDDSMCRVKVRIKMFRFYLIPGLRLIGSGIILGSGLLIHMTG